MASRIAQIASLPVLLLLGNAAAWAGRGDIDPNYGHGGRLSIGPSVLLALPDDRLMIGEGNGQDFRVRMVDATGQQVATFGDGGVVMIDSSAAARTFVPEAAALAPNGDMIFVGALLATSARALLRLDSEGQPVLSFGDQGDGLVEPELTAGRATALAVDADGKIFIAEGNSNPDSSCVNIARLQRLLSNGQPDIGFGNDGITEIPILDVCNGAPVFGSRADGSVIIGDGHTIVAVNAAGDIDPTFGVDGRLAVSELAWARALLLPDGGLLIFGSNDEAASSNDTVFLKFDRNGQPDLNFGTGTGSVTVDLGAELLGEPVSREYVDQLTLDPDGEHFVAQLSVSRADESLACGGIARLTIDGTPDAAFGRNGVTCLNFNFALVAVQSDGAPLFGYSSALYRLLPDNRPSPGFLRVLGGGLVGESQGTATVTIERFAGRDSAVSVKYATINLPPVRQYPYAIDSATAGSDYEADSGRLDWSSGDDAQRTVTIRIRDDHKDEIREYFGVDFSAPGGGAQLIEGVTSIVIEDDDETGSTASGGGGSVSWATPLALLALLYIQFWAAGRRGIFPWRRSSSTAARSRAAKRSASAASLRNSALSRTSS